MTESLVNTRSQPRVTTPTPTLTVESNMGSLKQDLNALLQAVKANERCAIPPPSLNSGCDNLVGQQVQYQQSQLLPPVCQFQSHVRSVECVTGFNYWVNQGVQQGQSQLPPQLHGVQRRRTLDKPSVDFNPLS